MFKSFQLAIRTRLDWTTLLALSALCAAALLPGLISAQSVSTSAPNKSGGDGADTEAKNSVRAAWMNRSLSPQQRADLLLKEMTLDEKIAMVHGVGDPPLPVEGYAGYVPPNPRLGIPALRLADGRAGVAN